MSDHDAPAPMLLVNGAQLLSVELPRARKGYDTAAVDGLLQTAAATVDNLFAQLDEAANELEELRQRPQPELPSVEVAPVVAPVTDQLEERAAESSRVLEMATRLAEQMIADATGEADRLRAEARTQSDLILSEAAKLRHAALEALSVAEERAGSIVADARAEAARQVVELEQEIGALAAQRDDAQRTLAEDLEWFRSRAEGVRAAATAQIHAALDALNADVISLAGGTDVAHPALGDARPELERAAEKPEVAEEPAAADAPDAPDAPEVDGTPEVTEPVSQFEDLELVPVAFDPPGDSHGDVATDVDDADVDDATDVDDADVDDADVDDADVDDADVDDADVDPDAEEVLGTDFDIDAFLGAVPGDEPADAPTDAEAGMPVTGTQTVTVTSGWVSADDLPDVTYNEGDDDVEAPSARAALDELLARYVGDTDAGADDDSDDAGYGYGI